jgi:hypothetical protein
MVERTNKEVNRHIRHICFDRRIKRHWKQALPLAQRIINSHFSERTNISPASILFGNALDLDRGIFAAMPESYSYPRGSLSSEIADMLKIQSTMIDLHKQRILYGDQEHTVESVAANYTVFDNDSYVLLEPATGKPKNRLHCRKQGPYRVISHENNTYKLKDLVTKKDFTVNIKRLSPFYFDENRVDPQEVAAHDNEEFIIDSIIGHEGSFTKKKSLKFHVRWVGYAPEYDTMEPWSNVRNVDKLHEYLRSIGQSQHIPKNISDT